LTSGRETCRKQGRRKGTGKSVKGRREKEDGGKVKLRRRRSRKESLGREKTTNGMMQDSRELDHPICKLVKRIGDPALEVAESLDTRGKIRIIVREICTANTGVSCTAVEAIFKGRMVGEAYLPLSP
jgi:hypothetical protein